MGSMPRQMQYILVVNFGTLSICPSSTRIKKANSVPDLRDGSVDYPYKIGEHIKNISFSVLKFQILNKLTKNFQYNYKAILV